MQMRTWIVALMVLVLGAAGEDSMRQRILVAEDARASTPEGLAPIMSGLSSPDATIVRVAVRALGRLERPSFVPELTKALAHADPGVRAEAANALGQSAAGMATEVALALRERAARETVPMVSGTIYRTIGRLPFKSAEERRSIESLLQEAIGRSGGSLDIRLGAVLGLDRLMRGARGSGFAASEATLLALRSQVIDAPRASGSEADARVRRVALAALNLTGRVDATYERALEDRDPQVRRLAIAGVVAESGAAVRAAMIAKGLADADPMVRYESLRVHGRLLAASDCSVQMASVKDANPHVALLALDQLATACPTDARATAVLDATLFAPGNSFAQGARQMAFDSPGANWRPAAHALVSLVRRTPDAAEWPARLTALTRHANWHVREYAARAAEFIKPAGGSDGTAAGNVLTAFASDQHANVREAAIAGLSRVRGHQADATYIAALDRPDYQVVMAACAALKGSKARNQATAALLMALGNITAQRRETSRDPRLAILDRLKELGGPGIADALRPYLSDFDARVAGMSAELLTGWTGQAHAASPSALAAIPPPTDAELRALPSIMRVTLQAGRSFDVRLSVDDTPLTVCRIVRLVRAGYYNGLTFHRVEPNFVIQGGSPGAHEVIGDGPFMRDEPGLMSNLRGTIGISTRGRDTGDAQLYINTVDSPRLDHTYYVFGTVIRGMDVVDLIVEGDAISRIDLRSDDNRLK